MPVRTAALAIAFLLAFAALSFCDYSFGKGDQLQYLVDLVASEDPGALGDDAYLRAFEALRSLFWGMIAIISTEDTVAAVCLGVAFVSAMAAALVLVRLGGVLACGESRAGIDLVAGTAAALVLVVPKEDNWFGIVSLSDVELTATSAVIPLVIGSMLAWARGRTVVTLILGVLTGLFHAQTAAYLLSAWVLAALWSALWPGSSSGRREPKRLVLPVIVGLGGLAAIIRERATNAVDAEAMISFEEAGLAMYAELLDPRYATSSSWLAVGAILAIGAASAFALMRRSEPMTDVRRAALVWTTCTLFFPAVGIGLLAFGARDPLLWRLMVGRSFMLPQIAALVLFAAWSIGTMRRSGVFAPLAGIALLLVAIWPFPDWPRVAAALGLGGVIVIIGLEGVRETAGIAPAYRARVARWVVLCTVAVIGIGGLRFLGRTDPWLSESVDPSWREAQTWARDNTEPGTLFLTPAYRAGWRIGAHRPTYGELNDGGLFFYAAQESTAWAQRMADLGLPARVKASAEFVAPRYAAALEKYDASWFKSRGIAYVVTEAGHDVAVGPIEWSSADYVIRRVER